MSAAALLSFVPIEQSQAQLMLAINPLQGDTNNTTLWMFSGSTTPELSSSIATQSDNSNHFGSQGWLYPFARTTGAQFLTTNSPARYNTITNHALTANIYSTPQITTPFGTRTISHITLVNGLGADSVGIRVSGSPLSYTANNPVSWRGRGILPYSITNLTTTASGEYFYSFGSSPYFAATGTRGTPASSGLRMMVSSAPVVPEPEEYALIFGLVALGFVIARRYWQRKRQSTTR